MPTPQFHCVLVRVKMHARLIMPTECGFCGTCEQVYHGGFDLDDEDYVAVCSHFYDAALALARSVFLSAYHVWLTTCPGNLTYKFYAQLCCTCQHTDGWPLSKAGTTKSKTLF